MVDFISLGHRHKMSVWPMLHLIFIHTQTPKWAYNFAVANRLKVHFLDAVDGNLTCVQLPYPWAAGASTRLQWILYALCFVHFQRLLAKRIGHLLGITRPQSSNLCALIFLFPKIENETIPAGTVYTVRWWINLSVASERRRRGKNCRMKNWTSNIREFIYATSNRIRTTKAKANGEQFIYCVCSFLYPEFSTNISCSFSFSLVSLRMSNLNLMSGVILYVSF